MKILSFLSERNLDFKKWTMLERKKKENVNLILKQII